MILPHPIIQKPDVPELRSELSGFWRIVTGTERGLRAFPLQNVFSFPVLQHIHRVEVQRDAQVTRLVAEIAKGRCVGLAYALPVCGFHEALEARAALYAGQRGRSRAENGEAEGASMLAQSGRASLEDGGYARAAESYARSVPLAGGLALAGQITRARMMLASNVSFAAAFESVLLKISEEYAKWPW